MATRTVGTIHGITLALMVGGFYVHRTPAGRKVPVSSRTRRLLRTRGAK